MRHFLFFSILSLTVGNSFSQGELPTCKGTDVANWTGCFGSARFSNGSAYEGEWLNGKASGKGVGTYHDGSKYSGAFKQGKANGDGIFTSPNGAKYEGQFKDDKFDGQGAFVYPDGRVQVGKFENGIYVDTIVSNLPECGAGDSRYWHQCFGLKIFPDGSRYVGEFANGNYNGHGITYNANPPAVSQTGYWVEGIFKYGVNLKISDFPFDGIRPVQTQNIEPLTPYRADQNIISVTPEKNNKSSIENAKIKCTELGFKTKTEGYGKCVLQLSK